MKDLLEPLWWQMHWQNLELRVWITDPENGRGAVVSDILLGIWDRFEEHGIEIPFPQQDLHIRSVMGERKPSGFHLDPQPLRD